MDTNVVSTTTISPLGCGSETFYYRVRLTVTDPTGLAGAAEAFLYPDCPPTNAPPRVLSISESPGGAFAIQCRVYAGRTYRFQYKNSLSDSNWTDLGTNQTAVSSSVAITNSNTMFQRYYRLLDVTAP